MATISRITLTGGGTPVSIAATATPGTALHTVTTTTADYEEIWLWASSGHTATVTLTLEWTGAGASKEMKTTINPDETILVAPGWTVKGAADTTIKAYSSVADVVNVVGYSNLIDAA